jgi:hypothetical protein
LRVVGDEVIFLEVAVDPLEVTDIEDEVEAERVIGAVDMFQVRIEERSVNQW